MKALCLLEPDWKLCASAQSSPKKVKKGIEGLHATTVGTSLGGSIIWAIFDPSWISILTAVIASLFGVVACIVACAQMPCLKREGRDLLSFHWAFCWFLVTGNFLILSLIAWPMLTKAKGCRTDDCREAFLAAPLGLFTNLMLVLLMIPTCIRQRAALRDSPDTESLISPVADSTSGLEV